MAKKVLITGGAGFIGSALSGHLQELGHEVFVLDVYAAREQPMAGISGATVAEHVSVLGFRKGKLGIQVESAPLLAELRGFRAEEIRQSMNAALERDGHGDRISEITFRIAGTGHA